MVSLNVVLGPAGYANIGNATRMQPWVLYDLPQNKSKLEEDVTKQAQLPDDSRQGPNGYDRVGYVGLCPPGHSTHRNVFQLYALDTKLNLPPETSKKQHMRAIKGHVGGEWRTSRSFPELRVSP